MNDSTGQILIVKKKEFGDHYLVWLFLDQTDDDSKGRKISPEFQTSSKAEAFALDWMKKNHNGAQ